jgi:hypothetical protein
VLGLYEVVGGHATELADDLARSSAMPPSCGRSSTTCCAMPRTLEPGGRRASSFARSKTIATPACRWPTTARAFRSICCRAFEPYVTTKARGTGLGLPIVKKIIDEHQQYRNQQCTGGGSADRYPPAPLVKVEEANMAKFSSLTTKWVFANCCRKS